MTDSSNQGIKTVLHPVSDLEKAKPVYAALLGVQPQADAPYYVGFDAAGQQIGLVPGGGQEGMTSPVAYWHVADIEAKLAEGTAAGASLKDPPRDVGGGRLVATVPDPDGHVLGLLQDPGARLRRRLTGVLGGTLRLHRAVDVAVHVVGAASVDHTV